VVVKGACWISVWFGRRQVRTCVWALCYRHRQKAILEKFSKVSFSKGSALHESCMPGVKLLYFFKKVLRFYMFHLSLFYLLLFLKFLTTWDLHTWGLHTGKLTCTEGGINANSIVCHSTELHTWTSLSVVRISLRCCPGASYWI